MLGKFATYWTKFPFNCCQFTSLGGQVDRSFVDKIGFKTNYLVKLVKLGKGQNIKLLHITKMESFFLSFHLLF